MTTTADTYRAASVHALTSANDHPTDLVGVTKALVALTHTLTAIDQDQQHDRTLLVNIAHNLGRIATVMEQQAEPKRGWFARLRRRDEED